MLLLNVVDITSFNTTFFSCFVFMKGEEKDDYKWALTNIIRIFDEEKLSIIMTGKELALMNALEMILPNSTNLLCVWHISKNILKNYKLQFLKEMEEGRTTVTSRIEGLHATLKAYLQMFKEDLHHVYIAISLVATNQKKKLDTMIASKCIRILAFAINNSLYRNIKEWPEFQQLAVQDTLKSIIDKLSMALQNPGIVCTKGHPSGAPNNQKVNSTKRDPSGFELVDPK
ncbi:14143_t:CDS:2, partial [Cetraspora pellucida]